MHNIVSVKQISMVHFAMLDNSQRRLPLEILVEPVIVTAICHFKYGLFVCNKPLTFNGIKLQKRNIFTAI